ncbi:MAG: glycosyltransferase [bacterium]
MQKIKSATSYAKFKRNKTRIVIFEWDYYIVKECATAFERLGCEVRKITVNKKDTFLKELLVTLCEFQPDFIFTVNHEGFDCEGKITGLLTELKIPYAIWYVDSPRYILEGYDKENVSPYANVFVWDPLYVSELQESGFKKVKYLPLGTDPEIFKLMENIPGKYVTDISFVGDSMIESVDKWKKKVSNINEWEKLSDETLKLLHNKSGIFSGKALKKISETLELKLPIDNGKLTELESYIALKATFNKRQEVLENILSCGLRIYGDTGWHKLFKNVTLLPAVNYYTQLPLVYNGSEINLNITSFQMPEGCNQRVFDVPAAGGFLITDERKTLIDLFIPKEEVITFKDKEELKELVNFYLQHSTERKKIAKKARQRVLQEHTYVHRASSIIETMREWNKEAYVS